MMKRIEHRWKLVSGSFAILMCCPITGTAFGQERGSRQTREFVQAAAQSDQFEILESDTALAQSTNPEVRAFAQAMIEAHQQTKDVLLRAAATAGLAPPNPGISGDQSMLLAALQSARGSNFDDTYIRQQTLAHRSALAVQQAYVASGDDTTIKQTATVALPIILAPANGRANRGEDVGALTALLNQTSAICQL
jgi:putative membrane protein